MRSIGGRGGERAVVSYCFGEEKGAEEEEEGFGSVMSLSTILRELENREIFTFPRRSSCIFSQCRLGIDPWLCSVERVVDVGLDSTFSRHLLIRWICGRDDLQELLLCI